MTVVEIVERERAKLRAVDATRAVALALVVTVLVVGAGAWLLAEARWIALPRATPLLVWAALVLANAVVWWLAGRMLRRATARASVAAAIEREQTLRAGALRGVLEVANRNALTRRADRALADHLSARGPSLAPELYTSSRNRAARTLGIAVVTLGLLMLAAPALNDGLLAIRRPIAAWRGTLVPELQFR